MLYYINKLYIIQNMKKMKNIKTQRKGKNTIPVNMGCMNNTPIKPDIQNKHLYLYYDITPNESLFISEYIKDWNIVRSLKAANLAPTEKDKKTHKQIATEILSKGSVQAALQQAMEYKTHRNLIMPDQIVSFMHRIAMADPKDMYNTDGTIKEMQKMPIELRYAVTEIDTKFLYSGVGEDRECIGHVTKVKLESKLRALMELYKMLTPQLPDTVINNNIQNNIQQNNLNLNDLSVEQTNAIMDIITGTKDQKLIELEELEKCHLQ